MECASPPAWYHIPLLRWPWTRRWNPRRARLFVVVFVVVASTCEDCWARFARSETRPESVVDSGWICWIQSLGAKTPRPDWMPRCFSRPSTRRCKTQKDECHEQVPLKWLKLLVAPLLALAVGFLSYACGRQGQVPILLMYFGAQTGMNLFIKYIVSELEVDREKTGIPIGFLLTAIQQLVAFASFCAFLGFSHLYRGGGYGYWDRVCQSSKRERFYVLIFSLLFAFNIGLNNFSLSQLDISVNHVIRSCLPLATALLEMVCRHRRRSAAAWSLLVMGVGCAMVANWCKDSRDRGRLESTRLGVLAAILSACFNGGYLVVTKMLEDDLKLSPIDATFYMALPVIFIMMWPTVRIVHPTRWSNSTSDDMTDLQVFQEVWQTNPAAVGPVFFSGVLAFGYNVLQYKLISQLEATKASFAAIVNMGMAVLLSLVSGTETLPERRVTFLLAILGNFAAFAAFGRLDRASGATAE